jgi:hypothetical protein
MILRQSDVSTEIFNEYYFVCNGKNVIIKFEGSAQLWWIAQTEEGDIELLEHLVRGLTGLELDEAGGLRTLDAETRTQHRLKLKNPMGERMLQALTGLELGEDGSLHTPGSKPRMQPQQQLKNPRGRR